jgi:hypothetical protein
MDESKSSGGRGRGRRSRTGSLPGGLGTSSIYKHKTAKHNVHSDPTLFVFYLVLCSLLGWTVAPAPPHVFCQNRTQMLRTPAVVFQSITLLVLAIDSGMV